jgi:hypothetical protein
VSKLAASGKIAAQIAQLQALQKETGVEHGFVIYQTVLGTVVGSITPGPSEGEWIAPKLPSVMSMIHSGEGLIFVHSHPDAGPSYDLGLSQPDVSNGDQAYNAFGFSEGMTVAVQNGELFCSRARF